ncbi:UNVERIFIED_CONTAM: arsenate reductase [Brevibacillus sp. OAP136]
MSQTTQTLRFYGYDKCGTCSKAKKWLEQAGTSYESIPIVDRPPSKDELRDMWKKSGLDLRKFFNTSGQFYKEMNLKDKLPTMTEEEMLELLASNGKLIKRPLATDQQTVTVGFKEDEYAKTWGKHE